MLTVLIVDDEKDVADALAEEIRAAITDCKCETQVDFVKATKQVGELRPDAIVLDLMEGRHSTKLPGQQTWKSLWDSSFCPVIIYTGWEGEIEPPVRQNHPFVQIIKKGSASREQVIQQLKGLSQKRVARRYTVPGMKARKGRCRDARDGSGEALALFGCVV
ncbi:MAG: hypothetical protein HOP29_05965, partial [Phycisphaerales bacterium]|nr:hypothetical protein [Phycisphaerales bacterium]